MSANRIAVLTTRPLAAPSGSIAEGDTFIAVIGLLADGSVRCEHPL
jgi:hypothetical protein